MGLFSRFRPPPGPSDEDLERQRRSQDELRRGHLPLAAQERLASDADEQTFTSALGTGQFAALRAAGWEPVGQAYGAAAFAVSRQYAYLDQAVFRPGGAINRAVQVHGWWDAEVRARELAQRRLIQECRALGGEGVVGVRTLLPGAPTGVHDLTLAGTAVRRVRGRGGPERADDDGGSRFLTELDGAAFTALVRGGWVPVALAFSRVCWMTGGYSAIAAGGRFGQTRELPGMTDLQQRVREQMRSHLEARVRSAPGRGLLLHRFEVRLEHTDDGIRADGAAIGTVIAPAAGPRRGSGVEPLMMLRLDGGPARPGTAG